MLIVVIFVILVAVLIAMMKFDRSPVHKSRNGPPSKARPMAAKTVGPLASSKPPETRYIKPADASQPTKTSKRKVRFNDKKEIFELTSVGRTPARYENV